MPYGHLADDLQSPLEEVRYAALRSAQGDPEVPLGLYLRALGDDSWRVRKEAMHALCTSPQPQSALAALGEALSVATTERLRTAAAETLLLFGEGSTPTLLRVLGGGTPEARQRAATLLGDLGHAPAVSALALALTDAERGVRSAAVEALTRIGTRGAIEALIAAVEAIQDLGTRVACLDALVTLRYTPSLTLLSEAVSHPATRRVALRLLARTEEPAAVAACLPALSDRARANREAALCAVNALRGLGLSPEEFELAREGMAKDDFEILRQALTSSDREASAAAMALAGWLGATELCVDVARAPQSEGERHGAQAALAAMGEAGVGVLLRAAEEASSLDRAAALEALGSLAERDAADRTRELALAALQDPHPLVAAAAAKALAALGAHQAIPALVNLMERGGKYLDGAVAALRILARDSHSAPLLAATGARPLGQRDDVDAAACDLCAALSGRSALSLVAETMKAPGARARVAAAAALARIGAVDQAGELAGLFLRDERVDVRIAALDALATLATAPEPGAAQEALAVVIEHALDSLETIVRARATLAIASLPADRAMSWLVEIARDDSMEVATAAVTAAARASAAPRIDRLTVFEVAIEHDDPDVVRAAARALAELDISVTLKPLSTALGHPRFEVRIAAAKALARHGEAARDPLRAQLAVEEDPLVRDTLRGAL